MKTPFPFYRQPYAKDCGPTCLRIMAKHYGEFISLKEIRELSETTKVGSNLSQAYSALKKAMLDWEHIDVLTLSIRGVPSFQEFWGANQFVNTGETIFSILPMNTSKLIGKLTIGQKVLVKLDNFPYQQYGMLMGSVKNMAISTDTEGNYIVYIPNGGARILYGKHIGFTQEMSGNGEIITEDLSIVERLFYKFKDVFKY